MSRSIVLFLALPSLALVGCQRTPQIVEDAYPDLVLSISDTNLIDFGTATFEESETRTVLVENLGFLPMGVSSIHIDEKSGMPANFSVSYDPADISCSAGTGGDDDGDTEETGGDSGDTGAAGGDILVIDGGCRLPVQITFQPVERGEVYGAMFVETVTQELEEGQNIPGYYADPYNPIGKTLFKGTGEKGTGSIRVTPRQLNFGSVWPGQSESLFVYVDNQGDGDLTLGMPILDKTCPLDYTLDLSGYSTLLEPGVGTLFEVIYAPESSTGTDCRLYVESDDPISGDVEVRMQGNVGLDPDNTPPRVQIISPMTGYVHTSAGFIELKMQLADSEQPANSLVCTVKAAAQVDGTLGSCTPESENGYVTFEVDTELLDPGPETLLVTVVDQEGVTTQASTTIIWASTGSEGDDDGDGFGNTDEDRALGLFDCDDDETGIYPGAAELCDGIDNDCDNAKDEDTLCADDDGDSVSELDGDCDDDSEMTYPGAPELADSEDNDCDDIIDEGTASFDGDGDGFALSNGDCNDADALIHPNAEEICDSIDNDCDSQTDAADLDGCRRLETGPMVIGGCLIEQRNLQVGESTTMNMFIYDPDNELAELIPTWAVSPPGYGVVSSPNSLLTTWTAPSSLEEPNFPEDLLTAPGFKQFLVYGDIKDPDRQQAWCTDTLNVFQEPITASRQRIDNGESAESSGCGGGGNAAVLLAPALGLLALGSRRRRRQG